MSYYIKQINSNFRLLKINEKKAFENVKDYVKKSHFIYGSDSLILNAINLKSALMEYEWELRDKGNFYEIQFLGTRLEENVQILHVLAPYVNDGSWIAMIGEDGSSWRYIFNGGKVTEIEMQDTKGEKNE